MSLIPPRTSKSPVSPSDCRLARTIELIGDRWRLLILRSAMYGVRRFDDFQTELGCPRTVLSGRLKALIDADLIARIPYQEPGKRVRSEYVLTEKGAALLPALIGLTQWGDTWLGGDEPAPIRFTDQATKSDVRVAMVGPDGTEVPAQQLRATLRRG